jgi:hypothetical protein
VRAWGSQAGSDVHTHCCRYPPASLCSFPCMSQVQMATVMVSCCSCSCVVVGPYVRTQHIPTTTSVVDALAYAPFVLCAARPLSAWGVVTCSHAWILGTRAHCTWL